MAGAHGSGIGYRADIDGLRALAVLPVLFYHAGLKQFSGGYVGVDIFFVISGYLITKIIASELDANKFSIFRFYERRIRRIYPCLTVVLIFVALGASLIFLPEDFSQIPKSVAATLTFSSNVGFYLESGYFNSPSKLKPLLHTWSLAVEEQFYVIFPILLIAVQRWIPKRRSAVVSGLAVLSFLLSVVALRYNASFAFFMVPTRAWELFAGSLLAINAIPEVRSNLLREVLAIAGLACICIAVFGYNSSTPFPGESAVLPVLGGVLLIHCAPSTLSGRLLASRPLVFVGLISYSLYLWHWPLVVFSEYYLSMPLSGWATFSVIALSISVAALSWRFIERPFRTPKLLASRRMVFMAAGFSSAAMMLIAIAGRTMDGWPERFSPDVFRLANSSNDFSPRRGECHRSDDHKIELSRSCIYGSGDPTAAIWGDSHSVEIAQAIGERWSAHQRAFTLLSYSSCRPSVSNQHSSSGCAEFTRDAFQYLISQPKLQTVIIVGAFEQAFNPDLKATMNGLREAVDALEASGKRVVIMYPVPLQAWPVPQSLAIRKMRGLDSAEFGASRKNYDNRNTEVFRLLDGIGNADTLRIRPSEKLCSETVCAAVADGIPLYFDNHHLSLAGARLIASDFDVAISDGPTSTHLSRLNSK